MKNFPAQLSGGEQQRVAIARALAKNPKLLLCDEPTGALDYVTGKNILKLLQDTCRRTGMTVVIITHNSALTAMANFGRAGFDNVIVPSASACVTFCLLTEEENRREFPRAIISMTDLFARRFIDNDLLAFSIPWKLYQEMEENVRSMSGNFLDRPAWKHLEGRKSRFFPARENPAPSRNLLAGAEQ